MSLGASLLGNLLTGKGILRAGSGNIKRKGIVRAGTGNKKGKGILRAISALLCLLLQKKNGIFNAA